MRRWEAKAESDVEDEAKVLGKDSRESTSERGLLPTCTGYRKNYIGQLPKSTSLDHKRRDKSKNREGVVVRKKAHKFIPRSRTRVGFMGRGVVNVRI